MQGELNRLSKGGKWQEMGQCIDETLLDKIALVGEPKDIAQKMHQRYGDVFDITGASVFSGDAYSGGEFSAAIAGAVKDAAS